MSPEPACPSRDLGYAAEHIIDVPEGGPARCAMCGTAFGDNGQTLDECVRSGQHGLLIRTGVWHAHKGGQHEPD